ncbi:porin [Microbulbifer guangxiensis]|uniref:porin n=1 Tax=Microbulbifer guangxiensis TaxID=2904249 RepID=UPI001F003C89|nr:porin [Microbulbifer guangxiensis]
MRARFGLCLTGLMAAGSMHLQAVPIYQSGEVTLYMSGYFSANQVNAQGDTEMRDGASRIRIGLNVPAYRNWDTGFNLEWGVRAISSASPLLIQGNQQASFGDRDLSLFLRQGHGFAKHDCWGDFTVGKQWGIYYDVAEWTDWYEISGGLGSGAYSLGTDGGVTGTGRADSALTWRKRWDLFGGEFQLGLQYQAHTQGLELDVIGLDLDIEGLEPENTELVCPPGDCEFELGHAVSLTYRADIGDGLEFGSAYNRMRVDVQSTRGRVFDISDPLEPVLVTSSYNFNASEDIWAWIAGINYGKGPYQQGFYGAVVYQHSQNNELAPEGTVDSIANFFDARGSESLFTYTWGARDCYSVYAGHNYLRSDDPEFEEALIDANSFRLRKYYLGFHYKWNERITLYTENTIDDSNEIGRIFADDVIAVGFRIDI